MQKSKLNLSWLFDLLLIVVLVVAGWLRFTGSDWGDLQHQHPDELSVTSVTYDIAPIGTTSSTLGAAPTTLNQPWRASYPDTFTDCAEWGGYFNTACSPLNPQNRGHNAFVYGSLPIFIVRYLAEWTGQLGNLKLFGRQLSAASDLVTIFLLYLIVVRLYGRRTALLAAAFSSLAVMQIQQSHFFTTDNFAVTFMTLAVLFAVQIVVSRDAPVKTGREDQSRWSFLREMAGNKLFWLSILFGLAYGMALASKLNAYPLALLLPLAFFIRFWKKGGTITPAIQALIITCLLAGGLASILSFRVFQPYAFDGLGINQLWLDKVQEQRLQATPDSDLPWNLQWARRTHLYSFENLTTWGLGLPLGILAWTGFLWMGWRIIKGEWRQHLLVWLWLAIYFGWQSMQYNPTMRYQLPIYPFLAMMAAWLAVQAGKQWNEARRKIFFLFRPQVLLAVLGFLVLLLTAGWAVAFSSIYTRAEPRIAASRWIYENVPAPLNLHLVLPDGTTDQEPLPFFSGLTVQSGIPYRTVFAARQDGVLTAVSFGHLEDLTASGRQTITLTIASNPEPEPGQVLASATASVDFNSAGTQKGNALSISFAQPIAIQAGQNYYLILETTGGSLVVSGSGVINETDYDWSLPFRIDGYDGFGGLYRGDLNLQIYWPDNVEKLERFLATLEEGDFISP